MTVRPEILSSLASVREDVERHLAGVGRYRAYRVIERTIAELAEFDDLAQPLSEMRDQVKRELNETREYRALQSVEKIVPELTEVLAFLAERAEAAEAQESRAETDAADAAGERVVALENETPAGIAPLPAGEPIADKEMTAEQDEIVEDIIVVQVDADEQTFAPANVAPAKADAEHRHSTGPFAEPVQQVAADMHAPISHPRSETPAAEHTGHERTPPSLSAGVEGMPIPSLAYSLAQMVVQTSAPVQRDVPTAGPAHAEKSESVHPDPSVEPVSAAERAA